MAAGVPSDRKVVIIATVTCASLLAMVLLVTGLLFWRGRKERYALLLGAEQSTLSSSLLHFSGVSDIFAEKIDYM